MAPSSNRSASYLVLRNWGAILPGLMMIVADVDRSLATPVRLPGRMAHALPSAPAPAPVSAFGRASSAPISATAGREDGAAQAGACAQEGPKEPLRGRIDRAVVAAARAQLSLLFSLPFGSGRRQTINGRTYLFCLEPHYHAPGGGSYPEGWHKGVTVYLANADV